MTNVKLNKAVSFVLAFIMLLGFMPINKVNAEGESGRLVQLGTFYLGGVKQLNPTRPWDGILAPGAGNVPYFLK